MREKWDGCRKCLERCEKTICEKMAAEKILKEVKRQDKPLSTAALPAGYHDRWSNLTKQYNGLCAWIASGENIVILNLAGGSKLDIYCWLFLIFFETFNSFVIVNLVSRQFVMLQMWNNWGYSKLICWLLTYSVHIIPFYNSDRMYVIIWRAPECMHNVRLKKNKFTVSRDVNCAKWRRYCNECKDKISKLASRKGVAHFTITLQQMMVQFPSISLLLISLLPN